MTLPIENYLAIFPATVTVRMGWLRRPVRLRQLTIGRYVFMDALGVDPRLKIEEKDAAIAAFVLSMTDVSGRPIEDYKRDFRRFERRVKGRLTQLAEAVNKVCADAFATYVKPPRTENRVESNTKTGAGWALDFAEALCADYGWSLERSVSTPLATVFALSAASLDRYNLRPNCMDYEQRKTAKEIKRHG